MTRGLPALHHTIAPFWFSHPPRPEHGLGFLQQGLLSSQNNISHDCGSCKQLSPLKKPHRSSGFLGIDPSSPQLLTQRSRVKMRPDTSVSQCHTPPYGHFLLQRTPKLSQKRSFKSQLPLETSHYSNPNYSAASNLPLPAAALQRGTMLYQRPAPKGKAARTLQKGTKIGQSVAPPAFWLRPSSPHTRDPSLALSGKTAWGALPVIAICLRREGRSPLDRLRRSWLRRTSGPGTCAHGARSVGKNQGPHLSTKG